MTETGTPEEQAPVRQECYRHPGRETGVRCTRCDRPICPECMNDAAVGFQCPECVKEGRKTVRQARTVFGGRVTTDPGKATRILIGLNVGVFVLTFLTGGGNVFGGGVTPLHIRFADLPLGICVPGFDGCTVGETIGVAAGEYYRLLTSMFLHYGPFHLIMNMYALLMVGDAVERALGRWRYATLYLLAGLGGSAASYSFTGLQTFPAGASGAVFGLFGAYFVIAKRLRLDTSQVVTVIALNVLIGFLPGIDWRAHMGGLAAGAALTALFAYVGGRARSRDILHVAGAAALLVVIAVVVSVRTAELQDLRNRLEGVAQPATSAARSPTDR